MRVLVSWTSDDPPASSLAEVIGGALEHEGHDVTVAPAGPDDLSRFDTIILGCCTDASHRHEDRWPFVAENQERLRRLPVWLYSWHSRENRDPHAPPSSDALQRLVEQVRARGYASFDVGPSEGANELEVADWARYVSRASIDSASGSGRRTAEEPLGRLLAALCLFVGATAIWGGVDMMTVPHGYTDGLSALLHAYAPFRDFFLPGLILASVVGISNTVAGYLALRKNQLANRAALVAGSCLTTWIVTEILLLRFVYWIQQAYLLAGIVILTIAAWREQRLGRLATTLRSTVRVFKHALVGWALCDATRDLLVGYAPPHFAVVMQAFLAVVFFAFVADWYFGGPDTWAPVSTALTFVLFVALLDVFGVACIAVRSFSIFGSLSNYWLPLLLIFVTTWAIGERSRRRNMTPTSPSWSRG